MKVSYTATRIEKLSPVMHVRVCVYIPHPNDTVMHIYPDQSSLFLNSPSENLLGSNSYIVEEGRIFELECTSNRDRASSLRLERQDGSKIITGK